MNYDQFLETINENFGPLLYTTKPIHKDVTNKSGGEYGWSYTNWVVKIIRNIDKREYTVKERVSGNPYSASDWYEISTNGTKIKLDGYSELKEFFKDQLSLTNFGSTSSIKVEVHYESHPVNDEPFVDKIILNDSIEVHSYEGIRKLIEKLSLIRNNEKVETFEIKFS